MRKAKIVCTLGPASEGESEIRALADAGMAVARLNASHATPEEAETLAERVRRVDATTDRPVATLLDLQGPEVRTLPGDDPFELTVGDRYRLVPDADSHADIVGVTHSLLQVDTGDLVLLDDGRIETRVETVDDDTVTVHVDSGGTLDDAAGINVPGVDLGLPSVTPTDETYLDVVPDAPIDFVAASFVRSAADVLTVSEHLETRGVSKPVVAKIERSDAVNNLDPIIDAAYGVMVARGDLGVECPMEDVPLIQKRIIRRARQAGVPVITATEMLDSMIHERRPTRAEASDVANAVFDGTDAVMLSAETAVGDHPVRVVETMDRLVRETEASQEYTDIEESRVPTPDGTSTDAVARSARYLARDVGATAVVVASESGYTARKTSKFHPAAPIVAATPDDGVGRQLALSWGVRPVSAGLGESIDAVIEAAVDATLDVGVADSGDTVVVVAGMLTDLDAPDTTNTVKVHVAAQTIASGRTVVTGQVVGPIARRDDGDLTDLPQGAILVVSESFDADFTGDYDRIGGIVAAEPGLTGYPAMVARELDVPMISAAVLDDSVADGTTVTLDADRGVVYDGDVRPSGHR